MGLTHAHSGPAVWNPGALSADGHGSVERLAARDVCDAPRPSTATSPSVHGRSGWSWIGGSNCVPTCRTRPNGVSTTIAPAHASGCASTYIIPAQQREPAAPLEPDDRAADQPYRRAVHQLKAARLRIRDFDAFAGPHLLRLVSMSGLGSRPAASVTRSFLSLAARSPPPPQQDRQRTPPPSRPDGAPTAPAVAPTAAADVNHQRPAPLCSLPLRRAAARARSSRAASGARRRPARS